MSEDRRNFWLAHYANRAAIALDRRSVPLTAEPDKVKELYELSEFYSRQTDNRDPLILQIIVDNFNRHYVYRHDLTPDIISDGLKDLCQLRDNGMTDSMVLDYHLLLLEYLSIHMVPGDGRSAQDLLDRVRETRHKSDSAFYIIKLYFLEITLLAGRHHWSEANESLTQALAFAYKKEMRPYVYKLTYIRAHLTIFEKKHMGSPKAYQQAVLALEQMIDTHGRIMQNLKREAFLLVQLIRIITNFKSNEISSLIRNYSQEDQNLLNAICTHIQGTPTEIDELLCIKSFFTVDGICFPTI